MIGPEHLRLVFLRADAATRCDPRKERIVVRELLDRHLDPDRFPIGLDDDGQVGVAAEDTVSRSGQKIDREAVGVARLRQQFSRALRVVGVALADRLRPLAPWGLIPI